MNRVRVRLFRECRDLIAFGEGSQDPAEDLLAVGWALMEIGRELRGKDPTHQRALIMAASQKAAEREASDAEVTIEGDNRRELEALAVFQSAVRKAFP